ncbi:MAG: hypothetical protein ACYC2H_08085 [Thermoplasmatota archaeon]
MHRAFALTVFAVFVAGCSTATTDDPAPPNADPNGQDALPTVSSKGTGTGPPTFSNSSSSSTTATPQPASFGPHDEEDSTSHQDFPGLFVNGRLQGSGPVVRIEATANNVGERAYRVPNGICQQPWSESMTGPGSTSVQPRQPMVTCAAFGLKEFAAHEFLSKELAWNGTLWDSASGSYVTAPSGSYTWTVTFDVYSGGSGAEFDEHAALILQFDVQVP